MNKGTILVLAGLCLSGTASTQSVATSDKTKSAPRATEIAKFFIEEPKKDPPYETGPLHIVYSDGTESTQTLPPYRAGTDKEAVFNDVGFSEVQLAEDRQTLGWTVDVENCCTSYPIPLRLAVFRHDHVLHIFQHGLMIWDWMFVQGGKQVAIVFGTVRGTEVSDYRLYDVETGKLISEASGDVETQSLPAEAPEWAKRVENRLDKK